MGMAFLVNPLGFIQFGPVFQAEFPVGSNIVVGPQIRLAGLGLLYHLVLVEGYASVGGMSFGVQGKYFLENPNSPHRFYIGGSGEFGFGSNKDNVGWSDEWHGEHTYIGFLAIFGYRWRFSSGFFVNVGLAGGFANELKDDWWYSDSPWDIRKSDIGFYIFGMAELSVGFGKY